MTWTSTTRKTRTKDARLELRVTSAQRAEIDRRAKLLTGGRLDEFVLARVLGEPLDSNLDLALIAELVAISALANQCSCHAGPDVRKRVREALATYADTHP